ncbi:RNA guanine-N7 methyltransferase activating subunit isoform X2 [Eubalaena glacialis]|uniref:RNA guanine-N7 methyltransferase activating subunit isoform X2 n=1 Tax=Eubalaena glacialis TaxID=27606 RepID=UPI002A5A9714|nr:RNA guanine-N7 methyltransferase activating subunit isoform X2 [Eubalaena glacialis]
MLWIQLSPPAPLPEEPFFQCLQLPKGSPASLSESAEMGALDSHSSLLLAPKFPGSDPTLSKLQMMTGFLKRLPKGTESAEDPTTQSVWQLQN